MDLSDSRPGPAARGPAPANEVPASAAAVNPAGAAGLLASIVEHSSDAIISKDLSGIVTSWNKGAERMFGFTAGEMIGQPITRIIPRERLGEEDRILATITRGELVESFETERQHRDGHVVPVSVTISPVRDASGRIIGASKVARDITQRRRLHENLREARDTMALLIEQAPVSIAMFDVNMVYLAVSTRWADEYGHGSRDLLGQLHYDVVPDMPEVWREVHRRGLAGAVLRSEEDEWQRRDGTTQWIRWAVHPWRRADRQIGGIIIFAEDITDRKLAARLLRESSAQFRQLAESLPQLIWATDATGYCDFLSRQWVAYTGVPAEPQLGFGWLEQVHPEDRQGLKDAWAAAVASGRDFHADFRIRRHDGKFRWFDARGVPHRDEKGNVVRWFGANTDVDNERNVREIQLRTQKMEALGTLAGGIAHDFNNILSAIRGNTALALEDTRTDDPSRQSLLEIERAAKRAAELVRRILAFSRQEEPQRQTLHLQGVVEEALQLLRATIPAQIELKTSFAHGIPQIRADGTQVHQVLMNLMANAAHAIGRSPGMIEIKVAPVIVDSQHEKIPPGHYACLTVTDTGCGMNRETQERIFDPFFTTKPAGEGTGLGLSVVDGIMKSHGGAVTVYSEMHRGTTFNLYFPATSGSPESESVKTTSGSSVRGKRILYVDDDDALVLLTVRKLTRLGYLPTGETDPIAALTKIQADPHCVDAVVTDLSMPRMTGFDLARELLTVRPDLPVVLTSGFVRPEDQDQAEQIGIRALIVKPNSVDELGAELDRIFSGGTASVG